MRRNRYCKECNTRIFELVPTNKSFGFQSYKEKTIKEWYFLKDGYYCIDCYNKIKKNK